MFCKENICVSQFNCHGCCENNSVVVKLSEYEKHFAPYHPQEVTFHRLLELNQNAAKLSSQGIRETYCYQTDADRIIVLYVGLCPHNAGEGGAWNCLINDQKPQGCRTYYCNLYFDSGLINGLTSG